MNENRTVSVTLMANIAQYLAALRTAGAATATFGASSAKLASDVGLISTKMLAFGTAAAVTAVAATKTMADFEHEMSLVKATTEAGVETMNQLREAALAVGGETQFKPIEAAEGIQILSKAGVDAVDILGGGLTGAMNLAAAGAMEVEEAGQIAASALNTFRLEGEQMPHVADLLASTANEAQGEVHDLGFALRMTAAVAAQTGLTIEETMASLGAMANRGLINSDAGTSLKSFLIHLVPTTDTAAAAMERIGLAAFNAQGEFIGMKAVAEQLKDGLADLSEEQQLVELRTIFGTDAIRAASVMYAEGADGLQKWLDANRDGYAAQFAETLNDNLIGDVKKLTGALHELFIESADGAHGPLRDLTQALTGVVEAVGGVDKFGKDKVGAGLWIGDWVRGLIDEIEAYEALRKSGNMGPGELFSWSWVDQARDKHLPGYGSAADLWKDYPVWTQPQPYVDPEAESLLAAIDSQMVSAGMNADGLAAAADRAAAATRDLGGSAAGAAGGVASLDEQMRSALDGAMSYIDTMQGVAAAENALAGVGDAMRESATYTIPGSSGGGGSSAASKARTKATNARIKAMREADQKKMNAEIERARERAQARAEARADAEARGDVQEGVKDFIETDKKAKRGENIDGFNNTNEVGEKAGKLTEKEQQKLDKQIEGIRERHKKALDAQIKALRDAQKAATGTASATKGYTTTLDENTEAGRKNRATISGIVDEAQEAAEFAYDAAIANGEGVEVAAQAARDALMAFYDEIMASGEAWGYNTDELKEYLAELGMVPRDISMMLRIIIDDADYRAFMKKLEATWAGGWEKYAADHGIPTAKNPDNGKPKTPTKEPAKTPTRVIDPRTTRVPFATGGEVRGPGTSQSDSVPTNLSTGEYVIRASQYAMNRDLVQAINSGTGKVPGGGQVGVLIEGGVHVTAPDPVSAGENVIDELAMKAYRMGAVR